MVGFIRCVIFFALIGASGFLLGRVLPKGIFHGDRFPFMCFKWERQGAVYNLLGVKKWKEKVPDMSRILPKVMPSKRLPRSFTAGQVELMVQETCVAEMTHTLLAVVGVGCVFLWKGFWGWAASVVYMLCNIPDIIIQRYNRPKLMRILQRAREKESVHEKCDHLELQHGTGA